MTSWHDSEVGVRFWAKVKATPSCWWWEAAKNERGYGQFFKDGRLQYAHRVSYEVLVGPIPEGLVIDHLCRNTSCVNPDHLEPVTSRENVRRGRSGKVDPPIAKARRESTHCSRGHEFTPRNTKIQGGYRACRTCISANARKYYRRVA